MKSYVFLISGLTLLGLSGAGFTADRTGVVGLNYSVGPSFIVGGSEAQGVATVEPGVGTALQLGLSRNVDVQFAYDYIDADLRTQALTFVGLWRFYPDRVYCPFAGAGMGFGKPFTGEGWDHFSLKLTGGVEKELTSDISLAGVMTYQYVEGGDPLGSVHAIEPGIRLTYYFGHLPKL